MVTAFQCNPSIPFNFKYEEYLKVYLKTQKLYKTFKQFSILFTILYCFSINAMSNIQCLESMTD